MKNLFFKLFGKIFRQYILEAMTMCYNDGLYDARVNPLWGESIRQKYERFTKGDYQLYGKDGNGMIIFKKDKVFKTK